MRLGTFAFFLGILLCQRLNYLPEIAWTILLFPLIVLIWILPHLRLTFLVALGLLWTAWHANTILAQKIPSDLEGQNITLTGLITGLPKHKEYGWQFDFIPDSIPRWPNPGTIRLSWYGDPPKPLHPGQQWLLTVRLKPAHGMLNPGSFDYSGQLFQQRISALGYVRPQDQPHLLSPPPLFHIDNLRYHLFQAIQTELGDTPSAGILIALALGNRQKISQQQQNTLRKTGIAHLIAISGLHIGLITWLSFWATRWLWCHAGKQTALWLPAPYFAATASLLIALGYALLAGLPLPTQRALIMITVIMLGTLFARQLAPSHILALALLLILGHNPLSVMTISFWLSFGAVTIIMYALTGRRHQPNISRLTKWATGAWKTQWAISLGIFPLILSITGYIPLTSLLANAIAIPWISLIVIPLTLLGTLTILLLPPLGNALLHIAAYTLDTLWVPIETLANWKWNLWQQHLPPLWTVLVAMLGITILLLPRGFPARWIGTIWLLPLFLTPHPHPQRNEVWLTLLDVGQGLAAVIRTANYTLIYDTGPQFPSGFNTGEAIIIPFLRTHGIQQLDKLIISHTDNDHNGGTTSLLATLPVNEILTSAPQQFNHHHTRPCQAGQHWYWDQVHFQILHPPPNYLPTNNNNQSCVLKITAHGGTILLPGDIEKQAEYRLLQTAQPHLTADILVIPHHGSNTSSTQPLIDQIQPQIALISSGHLNQFGHPKPEIIQRYCQRNIKLWNTAQTGAIHLRLTAQGISKPTLARQQMHRYWHNLPPTKIGSINCTKYQPNPTHHYKPDQIN